MTGTRTTAAGPHEEAATKGRDAPMMRGMFSAISGLKVNQTMLDVTANDLANVNTVGYKSARTTFQDSLAQLQRGAAGANQSSGGANALQVGLGVQLGSVDNLMTGGAPQTTRQPARRLHPGRRLAARRPRRRQNRPDRLPVHARGQPDGQRGRPADDAGRPLPRRPRRDRHARRLRRLHLRAQRDRHLPHDPARLDRRDDRPGRRRLLHRPGRQIGDVRPARRPPATSRSRSSPTRAACSAPAARCGCQSASSGAPTIGTPNTNGFGQTNAGMLEMSNVDLATQFTTMITAQRGFQANSRVISTADEMLQDLVNLKR